MQGSFHNKQVQGTQSAAITSVVADKQAKKNRQPVPAKNLLTLPRQTPLLHNQLILPWAIPCSNPHRVRFRAREKSSPDLPSDVACAGRVPS